jgi:ATP-dependent HslUV protease ATP-binding subunit HslU
VVSWSLNEILFDVPDKTGYNVRIQVAKELLEKRLTVMVKNRDLSQYIL